MTVVVLGLFFALGLVKWRQAVLLAMVLTVFEGALRKWVFQNDERLVYFAKDALLLGAYASYFGPRVQRRLTPIPRHPATTPLAILAFLAVMELANPSLPNLIVGVFGIESYLIYPPLMYMIPSLFPGRRDLWWFTNGLLLCSLVPLALGPIQFARPGDLWLNRYVGPLDQAQSLTGLANGYLRITSTFSYITGYTTFLIVMALLAVSLLLASTNLAAHLAWGGIVVLTLGNVLMTGSREPMLIMAVAVPCLILMSSRSSRKGREIGSVVLLAGLVVAIAVVVSSLFPDAQAAFVERATSGSDLPGRLLEPILGPVFAIGVAGPLGYGVGTTNQAVSGFIPTNFGGPLPPGSEGEWQRIILELGPAGWALVLVVRFLVSRELFQAFRAMRGTSQQPYIAAALLYSIAFFPGNLVFNQTASIYYWFLAGFGLMTFRSSATLPNSPSSTVSQPEPHYLLNATGHRGAAR